MTKIFFNQKAIFFASYLLLFICGLGTFSSTKGCVLSLRQSKDTVETVVTKKPHMQVVNPLQMFSSRFL